MTPERASFSAGFLSFFISLAVLSRCVTAMMISPLLRLCGCSLPPLFFLSPAACRRVRGSPAAIVAVVAVVSISSSLLFSALLFSSSLFQSRAISVVLSRPPAFSTPVLPIPMLPPPAVPRVAAPGAEAPLPVSLVTREALTGCRG